MYEVRFTTTYKKSRPQKWVLLFSLNMLDCLFSGQICLRFTDFQDKIF